VTDRPPQRHRRRDRRGRGLRGPLLPAGLPAARSRADRFDDLVADAVDRVARRWGDQLDGVEVAVEEVPPPLPDGAVEGAGKAVQLSRAEPATLDDPPRIVVHRRPVESRSAGLRAREDLVLEAVVEAVADLLGLSPDVVDPDGVDPDD
jgi:predicted Zn-dependent protease with MMP-like domain